MMAKTISVEKCDKLLQAIKKVAAEIEFGSFITEWKVHNGVLKEFEVSNVKRKFRAE